MGTRRHRHYKRPPSASQQTNGTTAKELLGDFILEDVHLYRLDRHKRIIHLDGEETDPHSESEPGVEHNMQARFKRNLGILTGINDSLPILVEMSTCGGYWEEGMAIFSSILTCPAPVTVLAHKWSRSMSSIIPLAADKFVLMPTAKYMFHFGSYTFSGIEQEANTADIERRTATRRMLNIYTARLKERGTYNKWSEMRIVKWLEDRMKENIDAWYDPHDAVRIGFADAVFDGNWSRLRATSKNTNRRKRMLAVLDRIIEPKITLVDRPRTHNK